MAKQVLSPGPAGSPGASGPGATSPTPGHPTVTPTAGTTASQPPLVPGMTASKREKPLGPDYDQAEPNFTKIEQTEIAKAISDLEGGSAASDVIKVNIEDGGLIEKYNTTGPLYNVYLKKEHVKLLLASGRILTKSADRSPVTLADLA